MSKESEHPRWNILVGAEPCPECYQGKHDNCDGTTWDEPTDGEAVCPCHNRGHVTMAGEGFIDKRGVRHVDDCWACYPEGCCCTLGCAER